MLAAFVNRLGTPDEIRCGELPAPRPGRDDVLVDVTATTVNPVDTFVRSGDYPTRVSFPFVIGRDLVGVVTGTGAGVHGFAPQPLVIVNLYFLILNLVNIMFQNTTRQEHTK